MPRHLILRKSGVHRTACFALHRALLRRKDELQLDEYQQRLFRKTIRGVFKRNSHLQSPTEVSTALQLGYETLEGLCDDVRHQRVLHHILELAVPPKTNAQPKEVPTSPPTKTARAQSVPKKHFEAYPGATPVLARPFLELSGRRHVPTLVSANRVPFLRLKKPQPPFLNRIIRDTVKRRHHRIIKEGKLNSELLIAQYEDEWDRNLYEHHGVDCGDLQERPWELEVEQALQENLKLQRLAIERRVDMAAKMYAIVEKEKVLAEVERLKIRDEKHKATKARRLARRGWTESEIQEKLYPHLRSRTDEETVRIKDARVKRKEEGPERKIHKLKQIQEVAARWEQNSEAKKSTNKQLSSEKPEEARQENTGKELHKSGHKFKTLNEIMQIREASLRPKTDDEIVKIKEARVKRREERAERKARMLKRKQEVAALCLTPPAAPGRKTKGTACTPPLVEGSRNASDGPGEFSISRI